MLEKKSIFKIQTLKWKIKLETIYIQSDNKYFKIKWKKKYKIIFVLQIRN